MILSLLLIWSTAVTAETVAEHGEYLVRAASCRECHTSRPDQDFAGGLKIATEFGDFYTPNITPDEDTGIGKWTMEQFRRALHEGISPNNGIYYPSFPYRSFTKMKDKDIDAIFIYLRDEKSIFRANRPHELKWPFDYRWLMNFWQDLFFHPPTNDTEKDVRTAMGPFLFVNGRSNTWNRGAYLVEAVLHCAECHTPRGRLGQPLADQWMAGSDISFSGLKPPNITPDPKTGVTWTSLQWESFLASGVDPDGKSPGVDMALAVRASSGLTKADRAAVVEYLRSLPKVHRENSP
jgi:mono/diheme cytochrome c family protein